MTISKVKSKSILKKPKKSSINNPRRSSPVKINSSKNTRSPNKFLSFIKNNKKLIGTGVLTSFIGGQISYNLLKKETLKKIINECKNDLTLNCFENANKKYRIKLSEKELKSNLEEIIMASQGLDIDDVLNALGLNIN